MIKKSFYFFISFILLTLSVPFRAYALELPDIKASQAILIEQTTGKVLYEKNADAKAYPASMTKILTAILLIENIGMDDIIVTGDEVYGIPADSSRAGHTAGESISGINLLRGLLLPSGNETGCVVAAEVIRRTTGDDSLPYEEAERQFANMMNAKAREIGAVNTHFVNPHGYHDDNHYTTARDMALICQKAMEYEEFSNIAREVEYIGNGVVSGRTDDMLTAEYDWENTNQLINPSSEFYYADAVGIKTGFTDQAGYCLSSAAERNGIKLIAVIFNDIEADRYGDSARLFEYGFNTYDFRVVQEGDFIIDTIQVHNPKLGEESDLEVKALGSHTEFLSEDELNSIERDIVYDEAKVYKHTAEELAAEKEEALKLAEKEGLEYAISEDEPVEITLPVKEGEVLGYVSYTLNGAEIYRADLVSTRSADERTKDTDREYYINYIKANMFTVRAIPFWIGGLVILGLIITLIAVIIRAIFIRKRRRRDAYTFSKRRRY
ncbi:MAG: D-alanyl-D-alanine carboxypeptidase [Clostridiales bacterium]|jgi:D-alanyl-D-alanine carboxypeptidase (penicillin-binding protein 5/6)|nr:D-alanyl-D-alanine carboxypeptidase [Clostridiales bacterium]